MGLGWAWRMSVVSVSAVTMDTTTLVPSHKGHPSNVSPRLYYETKYHYAIVCFLTMCRMYNLFEKIRILLWWVHTPQN